MKDSALCSRGAIQTSHVLSAPRDGPRYLRLLYLEGAFTKQKRDFAKG